MPCPAKSTNNPAFAPAADVIPPNALEPTANLSRISVCPLNLTLNTFNAPVVEFVPPPIKNAGLVAAKLFDSSPAFGEFDYSVISLN